MTEFDPLTATADQWARYLLNPENHIRNFDFLADTTPKLKRLVDGLIEAPADQVDPSLRWSMVNNAVTATLECWHAISRIEYGSYLYGSETPFEQVPRLAYGGNKAPAELVQSVQRLWWLSPRGSSEHARLATMRGLGKHLPMSADTLELLYRQEFDKYSWLVLRILLLKGEVGRATQLFTEHATRYGDVDPGTFDHLILVGLPIEAAKVWLDQSPNATSGSGHYEDALARWPKIAEFGKKLPEHRK